MPTDETLKPSDCYYLVATQLLLPEHLHEFTVESLQRGERREVGRGGTRMEIGSDVDKCA